MGLYVLALSCFPLVYDLTFTPELSFWKKKKNHKTKLSTPENTELKEKNWEEFKKEAKRWEEKASLEDIKKVESQAELNFLWEQQS